MNIIVKHTGGSIAFDIEKNMKISDLLSEKGIFIDRPCGGKGTCGKCKVIASGCLSEPADNEKKTLKHQLADGYRLACEAILEGDCTVALSDEASSQIVATNGIAVIGFEKSFEAIMVDALEPTLENQLSDEECLNLKMPLTLNALKKLPSALRQSGYNPYAVVRDGKIIDVGKEALPVLGLAVDIGTTTVAVYFYDLITGERLSVKSDLNTQREFGADVISRIEHCKNQNGINDLQNAIINLINRLVASFCSDSGFSFDSIYMMTVAANTTMLHLLCGIDPNAIASSPFIPATSFGFELSGESLGLTLNPEASVYLIPSVSAYVGGDITAGIAACSLPENCLFIDVGTNGEMAINANGRVLGCSVAAGPAFEGAHIEFGTGGIHGAISGVKYTGGNFSVETINNSPPVGICGSGIIDATAALLNAEVVDMTGRLVDADEIDSSLSSRLSDDRFYICDKIAVTAQDIREIQLAKAAICAGIITLAKESGISLENIEKVLVAGGFGSHMNPDSAIRIGLFPKELDGKIEIVGNAAGMGACKALLEKNKALFTKTAQSIEYIELSGHQDFMDAYIDQMIFE